MTKVTPIRWLWPNAAFVSFHRIHPVYANKTEKFFELFLNCIFDLAQGKEKREWKMAMKANTHRKFNHKMDLILSS